MEWKIKRVNLMTKMPLFYSFLFFFSVLALFTTINTKDPLDIRCHSTTKSGFNFQDFNLKKTLDELKTENKMMKKLRVDMGTTRRNMLSGPGSWPPRCTSKCGNCTPCKPVHVSVPPGTPVTAEYYPEAWRCKCGNRLYMP